VFRIYSFQRETRPVRSIVGSAICLLVAVGLAWLLLRQKQAAVAEVPLGERSGVADWPLSLRLPKGWRPAPGRLRPRGLAVSLREPSSGRDEPSRVLYVIRRVDSSFQPPVAYCRFRLPVDLLGMVGHEAVVVDVRQRRFGPLAGAVATIRLKDAPRAMHMAYVGCSPNGEVYLLLLGSPWGATPGESRLLERIADTAQVTSPAMHTELGSIGREAGLAFALPAGARVVAPDWEGLPRVRLCSEASATTAWSLDVVRTWVSTQRPPEHLVADLLRKYEERLDPVTAIREVQVGARQAAEALIDGRRAGRATLGIWVARLGDRDAVLLVGRTEPAGERVLRTAAERVISTVRLTSGKAAVALDEALGQGKRILRDLRQGGLERLWGRARHDEWYVIRRGDAVIGAVRRRSAWVRPESRRRGDRTAGYEIVRRSRYEFIAGIFEDVTEHWWVTAGGDAYRWRLSRRRVPIEDYLYRLDEVRRAGSGRLERRVELEGRRKPLSYELPVDEGFVCDEVATAAALLAARDPEARPVALATTGLYSRQSPYLLVCRPAGMVELGEQAQAAQALVVVLQRDYEASFARYFFDVRGRLIRAEFEDGTWVLQRAAAREVLRVCPAARPLAR